MATVASQVVLHPLVSQTLKFGGTTAGRDKTYRAVQYLSRFLVWYFLNKGDKAGAARWNALKSHLGTARKLLRLGKPVEHLQAALRLSLASAPPIEQITAVSRQIAYFGYLSHDAFVWANAVKFIQLNPETTKRVSKTSNRFWLAGILLSIVHGIAKSMRLAAEAKKLKVSGSWVEKDVAQEAQRESKLATVQAARAATRRQFIIDLLDIWLPASGLELTSLNEGVLGIFGLISSIMGMQTQWNSVLAGKK